MSENNMIGRIVKIDLSRHQEFHCVKQWHGLSGPVIEIRTNDECLVKTSVGKVWMKDLYLVQCSDCDGTGVSIVTLDDTNNIGIQRCDTCRIMTDAQAVALVKKLLSKGSLK